jgi:hypothetical protein
MKADPMGVISIPASSRMKGKNKSITFGYSSETSFSLSKFPNLLFISCLMAEAFRGLKPRAFQGDPRRLALHPQFLSRPV